MLEKRQKKKVLHRITYHLPSVSHRIGISGVHVFSVCLKLCKNVLVFICKKEQGSRLKNCKHMYPVGIFNILCGAADNSSFCTLQKKKLLYPQSCQIVQYFVFHPWFNLWILSLFPGFSSNTNNAARKIVNTCLLIAKITLCV